ncbi:MAG: acetyl-CoA carboxylase biotin carboxyl carrier protein [Arenicellales bacterium]
MDLRKVKKLIELLEESNLIEMEIREGEESIRLSRGFRAAHHTHAVMPAEASPGAGGGALSPEAATAGEDLDSAQGSGIPSGHQVTSPMVGTYYAAAEPNSAPYVTVGSTVEQGDTLCVIEAMKIFNQIESDAAGTVVHVQKDNGDAVEYGELLFVIQ